MKTCTLLVVGAGAAGISAAVSAWEAGCRDILLVDRGTKPGGVLLQCSHEGFGLASFGRELTGPVYASVLAEKLEKTGVRTLFHTEVISISKNRTALISGFGMLEQIRFQRLILAAGCREKTIGSLPIAGTRPAGIFTAGQAQEMMNLLRQDLGDHVLILGCGDLGMILAREFVLRGKHVIAVLEQNTRCGGLARNYHRCIEKNNVPVFYCTTITEVHGKRRISGVTVRHLDSRKQEFISCDTLITAIGLVPEQKLTQELHDADWIACVGNCSRIYDLVDSAVAAAETTGSAFAAGAYPPAERNFSTNRR